MPCAHILELTEKRMTMINVQSTPLIDELMHYGVLGMKWGIHKKDSSSEDGSTKKGLSPEQKKKLRTAAIVVGSAAAVAAGAYFTKRYIDMNGTKTLKAGTNFQHMAKFLNEDFSKPVYVSYLKSDNKEYRDGYFHNVPYIKTLVANKDIKIAGKKEVLKAFEEWSKTNSIKNSGGKVINEFTGKSDLKRAYLSFNYMLVSPDQNDRAVRDSFFNFLSNKGYAAIHDAHDQQKGSGIKAPLILFAKNSEIMTKAVKEIDPSGLSNLAREKYEAYKNMRDSAQW